MPENGKEPIKQPEPVLPPKEKLIADLLVPGRHVYLQTANVRTALSAPKKVYLPWGLNLIGLH